ncbi:MAG: glucuronate isomerase [Bacteroidetes bacterium]|nr:glucuronate isomerase [Bacteroidota bacterium]
MKTFPDENFLLHGKHAVELFERFAQDQPIIDYHCHLSPKDIAEDRRFDNLSQAWLAGDHYKWRAMRTNGIDERFCTGDAEDYEKFEKWAQTVPFTLRNPLYHWTHLELQRYFGIRKLLHPGTARDIYDEASSMLNSGELSVRNMLRKMKVELVCTTDDPADTLEHHQKIAADGFEIKVVPAWRPDKAIAVDHTTDYNHYLDKLSQAAGIEISRFEDLLEALHIRHDYFHQHGCRISDHGLDKFYVKENLKGEVSSIFNKVRRGLDLDQHDVKKFKSAMLYHLGVMDHEKNWVQQFHVGAMRNNNHAMFQRVGPDTGFDSIGDLPVAEGMSRFLDKLNRDGKLTKTILYNLNPADNELYATMIGNFQDGIIPGKIQWGAGWWFLDQKEGIERHLNTLSSLGLLSRFVGMLTDSRSFLSFPRHEYFRRILCNMLGNEMERGELPDDIELVGGMVAGISYHNAASYFSF